MAVFLQALCCVAFATSALLFSGYTSDNQLAATQLISQLAVAELIPVALVYFRSFRKARPQNPIWLLILLLPFALFIAELMFVAFLGHADSVSLIKEAVHGRAVTTFASAHARMLYDCIMWIFPALLTLEFIFLLSSCLRVIVMTRKSQKEWSAFLKGKSNVSTTWLMAIHLVLFFSLFLLRYFVGILTHSVWAGVVLDLLLSVATFLLFFNGMFEAKETVSLSEVLGAFRYNTVHYEDHTPSRMRHATYAPVPMPTYTPPESSEVQPAATVAPKEQEAADHPESPKKSVTHDTPSVASTPRATEGMPSMSAIIQQLAIDEDSLQRRFEEVMANDQLFLMPGITLTYIAERLNTNKTYLSRMINSTYNLAFPDYLNMLRIDYAEQYILHNRGARQSEVAMACGFSSPSAFNNTFKKITGVTPKVWLATHDNK